MKSRRSWLASLVAAAGLIFAFGSSPVLAQGDLFRCQQGIEKEAVKIQALILKALQLCKDKYRQTVVKVNKLNSDSNPGNDTTLAVELPRITRACDGLLAKTIGIPGGNLNSLGTPPSQVQKTYQKLNALLAPGKCTDAELAALGYLPSAAYGDAWIRWLITAMLKAAYEKQIWIVADTPGIMVALCDANGNNTPGEAAGPTGDCPTCCKLQVPPCNKLNCRLAATSGSTVQLLDTGFPIPLALGKEIVSEYCQYPDFIGSDIAVVGNPSRTIDELSLAGNSVCVTQLRAMGFIKCGASSLFNGPKDVQLCADSNGGACNTGACLPQLTATTACPSPALPLRVCQQLSPTLATANDTVVLSHLQIEVAPSPPGCTGAGGNVVPTVLTTGSVTVSFDNFDGSCSGTYSNTVNGSAGTCPTGFLDSADLAGTTLVGGFPAYQSPSSALGDTVTTFNLVCEP